MRKLTALFHSCIFSVLIWSLIFAPLSFAAALGYQIDLLLSQVRTASGGVLAGGHVHFYAAGGTTPKTIWTDVNMTAAAANPYQLTANGTALLYGSGLYRIVIHTSTNAAAYDFDNVRYEDLSSVIGRIPRAALDWGSGATQIPRFYDNNAFSDNLTLYGNDLIVKGPWVDVRWKGAICDDTADDTVALRAVITAVENTAQFPNPPTILFPGKCVVTGPLTVTRGELTFKGANLRSGIHNKSNTTPAIYSTASSMRFVDFVGSGNNDATPGYVDNAMFLDYNASGGALHIQRSRFWHNKGDGVRTRGGVFDTVVTDSYFQLNAGNGFNSTNGSQNGNATTVKGSKFSNNLLNGFAWGSGSGLDLTGNTIQGNTGAGAYILGGLGVGMYNNYYEANDNSMIVFDTRGSNNLFGLAVFGNYALCKNNAAAYVDCIRFVGDTDNTATVLQSEIGRSNYWNSDVSHLIVNGGNQLGADVIVHRGADASLGGIDNVYKAQIKTTAKRLYLTGGQKIAGTITYSTSPNLSDNVYSAGSSTIYLPLVLPNESFIEHVKTAVNTGAAETFDLQVDIQRMAPTALDPYATVATHTFTSQTWGQKSWTGINLRMVDGYNYILKLTFSNMASGLIQLSDTEVAWD